MDGFVEDEPVTEPNFAQPIAGDHSPENHVRRKTTRASALKAKKIIRDMSTE